MVAQRRQQPPARQSMNPRFLTALGLLAAVGVIVIVYVMNQPKTPPAVTTVDPATLGPAKGYLLGKPDAPVQIIEFADFECPACGNFAVVTEPDVRKRIIETGL